MGTTSKGLWYPDASSNISPLQSVLSAMQVSVGNNIRLDTPAGVHVVTNAAGLTTLVSNLLAAGYTVNASNPAYAYRVDTQLLYENRGGGWVQFMPTLTFATTGERDTAVPVGSRRTGMTAAIGTGSSMLLTAWNGSAWVTVWDAAQGVISSGDMLCHKEPSGLMIFTARVSITIATSGTAVSTTLTYPAAFTATPRLSAVAHYGSPTTAAPPIVTVSGANTTSVTVWANRAGTGAVLIDVTAVGRWK